MASLFVYLCRARVLGLGYCRAEFMLVIVLCLKLASEGCADRMPGAVGTETDKSPLNKRMLYIFCGYPLNK